MKPITAALILLALLAPWGCASGSRDSPEAAWRRGQCGYIIDDKLREKCLEQVDREFGRL
jgi:hypothetical protein